MGNICGSTSEKIEKAIKKSIQQSADTEYKQEERAFPNMELKSYLYKEYSTKRIRKQNPKNIETISIEAKPIPHNSTAQIEKVFDSIDSRRRVLNTQDWPSSANGLVRVSFKGTPFWGSGTVISPYVVLTAAQNIYSRQVSAYADTIEFLPAMNERTLPFGKVKVEEYFVPQEYITTGASRDNYALIFLESPIGEETGFFALSWLDRKDLLGKSLTVTGYPSDKVPEMSCVYQMWEQEDKPISVDEDLIHYTIATAPGNSGSGVWYEENGKFHLAGVHLQGGSETNEAMLLTKRHYNQISTWIKGALQKRLKENPERYVKRINFRSQPLGDTGVSIFSTYRVSNLQDLNLCGVKVGDIGAEALARNTTWAHLQVLNLAYNTIGNAGAEALAKNTTWFHLEELNLSTNQIGNIGAEALARNNIWVNLKKLFLSSNQIEDVGIEALARNTTWIDLDTLDISINKFGCTGVEALKNNTTWTNLESLRFFGTNIGDAGAEILSRNTSWTKLQRLDLSINQIGNKGANTLANNTSWVKLKDLSLTYNQIGNEAVEVLACNSAWPNLEKINLAYNKVSEDQRTTYGNVTVLIKY